MKPSPSKKHLTGLFHDHVSSGKADFFRKYGMDFVMGRREGPWIFDIDGTKRLFNLHCNGGVFNLGHRHPEIIDLLRASLDEADIGNHHLMSRERAMLGQRIADLMPGDLSYTIFGVGGGEAVDLSIKIARAHTGRPHIISARGGYHGHTGLALAAGDEKYRAPFGPQASGFRQIPFNDIPALEAVLNDQTAAVILETIPATLGMVVPPDDYLPRVRELCDGHNTLLIMDEVQTGLGRTGKLWGFEHYDIVPDIVVLGKGLSGGVYPISATVIREPLEKVFRPDPFIHISTFGGAEIGCRVAQRVLDISSQPDFLAHVNTMAEKINADIESLKKMHGRFLKGLRQRGLMMALELEDDLSGPILTKTAYDHDLLMIFANNDPSCCQFLPPLTITDEDRTYIVQQLDRALGAAPRMKTMLKAKQFIDKPLAAFNGAWKRMAGKSP